MVLHPESDFSKVRRFLKTIPGMIDVDRCMLHLSLCFGQDVLGEVVEIGAWQGRNSIALAYGCKASRNGHLVVIDHFEGNPESLPYYRVIREDLSDLQQGFHDNVARSGLGDWIELFARPREEFDRHLPVRLLFEDGNHAYEAVAGDLMHFEDLLQPGALVIMDDYSPEFDGVVKATQEFLDRNPNAVAHSFGRSLVIRLPR